MADSNQSGPVLRIRYLGDGNQTDFYIPIKIFSPNDVKYTLTLTWKQTHIMSGGPRMMSTLERSISGASAGEFNRYYTATDDDSA
jgi:hypothetical protein